MTSQTNTAPVLCYVKLCALFESHRWIKTVVTVQKLPIWVKNQYFFSRATLGFDRWPWKTIRYLFYATLSFVLYFIAIYEFKLELQSRNAQFGGQNGQFFSPVWPWNLTEDLEKAIGHLFYGTSGFVYHFTAIGQFKLELQSGNA